MNWDYIITPWQIYANIRKWWTFYKIDEQNKIKFWNENKKCKLEDLDLVNVPSTDLKIKDFLKELWTVVLEKWNFLLVETKDWDNIYIYNSIVPILDYDNWFLYAQIFYENQEDLLKKKTQDFCNYSYLSNIDNISNLLKLETIRTKEDFISSCWNDQFIEKWLRKYDDKILQDLVLLWKDNLIWIKWKIYLYAFLEEWWRFIPIRFTSSNAGTFELDQEKSFEKVSVIYHFEWKNKISLLFEKINDQVVLFQEDVITKNDLESFYIKLFEDYTNNQ